MAFVCDPYLTNTYSSFQEETTPSSRRPTNGTYTTPRPTSDPSSLEVSIIPSSLALVFPLVKSYLIDMTKREPVLRAVARGKASAKPNRIRTPTFADQAEEYARLYNELATPKARPKDHAPLATGPVPAPKVDGRERLSAVLYTRVTREESADISAAVARDGYTSRSEWIRHALRKTCA